MVCAFHVDCVPNFSGLARGLNTMLRVLIPNRLMNGMNLKPTFQTSRLSLPHKSSTLWTVYSHICISNVFSCHFQWLCLICFICFSWVPLRELRALLTLMILKEWSFLNLFSSLLFYPYFIFSCAVLFLIIFLYWYILIRIFPLIANPFHPTLNSRLHISHCPSILF